MKQRPSAPTAALNELLAKHPSENFSNHLRSLYRILSGHFARSGHYTDVRSVRTYCVAQGFPKENFGSGGATCPFNELIQVFINTAERLDAQGTLPPHVVLEGELAAAGRSDRRENLIRVYEECERRYTEGLRTFEINDIARSVGKRHKFSISAIRHKTAGGPFRAIIESWKVFALGDKYAALDKNQVAHDKEMSWVYAENPELAEWAELARAYLDKFKSGVPHRIHSIRKFIKHYLSREGVPHDIDSFLLKTTALPPYENFTQVQQRTYQMEVKDAADFLDWVLLTEYSDDDDDDIPRVINRYRNPFKETAARLTPQ